MAKEFKSSETEKNLLKAFAGESQARNRYTYFTSVAKKEGYEQISAIFLETADNEKEHAKVFFNHLQGGMLKIEAEYPAGITGNTEQNLLAAAEGEKAEHLVIYPEFEKIARQESFSDVATSFKEIAEVEKQHEKRYRKLLDNLKQEKVFSKDKIVKWKCRNCGYVHEGKSAPDKCPACKHPQAFYELWVEAY